MSTFSIIDYENMTDEELLGATRAEDFEAYAALWRRHATASRRLATSISSNLNPDDLVAEAYTKTLEAIQRGTGPLVRFRAYISTVIRNTAADWGKQSNRISPIGDAEDLADLLPTPLEAESGSDDGLVLEAFNRLPEQTRLLLWYSVIEGYQPREIAPMFKMTVNSVTVAASRARSALKKSWLQAYVDMNTPSSPHCAEALGQMGSYLWNKRPTRADRRVDEHLAGCASCSGILDQAKTVDAQLHSVLLPLAGTLGLAGTPLGLTQLAIFKTAIFTKPISLAVSVLAVASVTVAGIAATQRDTARPAPDAAAMTQSQSLAAPNLVFPGSPLGAGSVAPQEESSLPTSQVFATQAPHAISAGDAPASVAAPAAAVATTLSAPSMDFADGAVFDTTTPVISGTAEPGSTVTAVLSGGSLGYKVFSALTSPLGAWSFATPELDNTSYGLRAFQTSEAGERSAVTSMSFVVNGLAAAPLPVITSIDTAGSRYAPAVTGTGVPGAEIACLLNGVATSGFVRADGTWTIVANNGAVVGANTLTATQTLPHTKAVSLPTSSVQVTLEAPSGSVTTLTATSLQIQVNSIVGSSVGVRLSDNGTEHLIANSAGVDSVQFSPNAGAYDPSLLSSAKVRYVSPDGLRFGPYTPVS